MSSFRHVLVTTFFVILNLMADTGIGIRVCKSELTPINLILEKTYILQQKAHTKKTFRSAINLYRL